MVADLYNQSTFLVIKAAYLFYIQEKTQAEIAELLNISTATVSRLIKKAIRDKLIQFVITDPYLGCISLEEELKSAFGLKDVVVAPVPDISTLENGDYMRKLVALEGARYIQRIVSDSDILGISFGKTMYYLIHYLNPSQKVSAAFVTMHGSVASVDYDEDIRTLVSRMAMSFGGKNYSLACEGIMSCEELAASIEKERNINKIFQMYNELTIAVLGIGSWYPEITSVMPKNGYLNEKIIDELKTKNVAGDLNMRLFDLDGLECDTDLKNRTIAIGFEELKKVNRKIAVAAGVYKTDTMLAALKGNLINVLIVDYYLGKSILEKHQKSLNSSLVAPRECV